MNLISKSMTLAKLMLLSDSCANSDLGCPTHNFKLKLLLIFHCAALLLYRCRSKLSFFVLVDVFVDE